MANQTYLITNNSKKQIALENQVVYTNGTRSFTMSDAQYDSFRRYYNDLTFEASTADITTVDITRDSRSPYDAQHVIVDNISDLMGGGGDGAVIGDMVAVSNFPSIQPVSGTVQAAQSGSWTIAVNNFPASQTVNGTVNIGNYPAVQTVSVNNLPATQPVSGTLNVGNFPASQTIAGTVSVGNFPATQAVSGTVGINNFPAIQPVSGTINIANFPTTQAVSGTINVGNFPATQAVSGTLNIGNFPATQAVTGTLQAQGTYLSILPTLASGTTNSLQLDANGRLLTASDLDLVVTPVTPQTTVNSNLASFDTTGFKAVVVQMTGTWAGNVAYEASNDGVTWTAQPGYTVGNTGSATPSATDSTNALRMFAVYARFFRVRLNVFTSGVFNAVIVARQTQMTLPSSVGVVNTPTVIPTVSSATVGATIVPIKSAATTNAAVSKTSAGNVFDYSFSNNTTTAKWFKFYNKASAPVVGTDATYIKILLPPMSTVTSNPSVPIRLSTGIAYAITGAVADTDTTATAVDDVTGYFNYA